MVVVQEPLLTLARCLEFDTLLQHCESVLAAGGKQWCEEGKISANANVTGHCLLWLQYADSYMLQRWRHACINVIAAAGDRLLWCEQYNQVKKSWSAHSWCSS